MIVLELAAGSIVIDCGMFQGRRAESRERNRTLPVQASAASVAILTHSHIDHFRQPAHAGEVRVHRRDLH
jgi:metallo-beta-lactamase family protein